jgi:hypothetical protein
MRQAVRYLATAQRQLAITHHSTGVPFDKLLDEFAILKGYQSMSLPF